MVTDLLKSLEQYMFSSKNMVNYTKINNYMIRPIVVAPMIVEPMIVEPIKVDEPMIVEPIKVAEPMIAPVIAPVIAPMIAAQDDAFTPFQKDKLFWCFYVLVKGFSEYEINRTGFYAVEKAFKISTVEQLRSQKQEIKDLKLKINEVEDELVNKEQITLKGLQVLCLVHKVSITYIYGKKYCEFNYGDGDGVKGVIRQNDKKVHSLCYTTVDNLPETHWYIENVQKPLKAPSAYTLKELQDICAKLDIPLKHADAGVNVFGKSKTKKDLYEEILTKL
jgi:hypothetical protein